MALTRKQFLTPDLKTFSQALKTHSRSHTLAGSQGWRKERAHPLRFISSQWCFLGKTIRDVASFPAGSNWCPASVKKIISISLYFVFVVASSPELKTKLKGRTESPCRWVSRAPELSHASKDVIGRQLVFFFVLTYFFLACDCAPTRTKPWMARLSLFLHLVDEDCLTELRKGRMESCILFYQMTEDTTGAIRQNYHSLVNRE